MWKSLVLSLSVILSVAPVYSMSCDERGEISDVHLQSYALGVFVGERTSSHLVEYLSQGFPLHANYILSGYVLASPFEGEPIIEGGVDVEAISVLAKEVIASYRESRNDQHNPVNYEQRKRDVSSAFTSLSLKHVELPVFEFLKEETHKRNVALGFIVGRDALDARRHIAAAGIPLYDSCFHYGVLDGLRDASRVSPADVAYWRTTTESAVNLSSITSTRLLELEKKSHLSAEDEKKIQHAFDEGVHAVLLRAKEAYQLKDVGDGSAFYAISGGEGESATPLSQIYATYTISSLNGEVIVEQNDPSTPFLLDELVPPISHLVLGVKPGAKLKVYLKESVDTPAGRSASLFIYDINVIDVIN